MTTEQQTGREKGFQFSLYTLMLLMIVASLYFGAVSIVVRMTTGDEYRTIVSVAFAAQLAPLATLLFGVLIMIFRKRDKPVSRMVLIAFSILFINRLLAIIAPIFLARFYSASQFAIVNLSLTSMAGIFDAFAFVVLMYWAARTVRS